MRAYSIILFMSCPFSYARLYKDVQNEVDLCHRDGTLKQKVFVDPKRYECKIASISQ